MTPLIFQAVGLAVNAILDPLLIIGIGPFPRLGLNGAAWASLVALGVAFALAMVYLNRRGPRGGRQPAVVPPGLEHLPESSSRSDSPR